jgi:Helix-turn-helix domain
VEHREAEMRSVADFSASRDDTARFLRELRQLRDGAGLGHAELAARAHFPYDSIRAAEVGPALPELPVLSAYVRGCGGTTEEWEERWRSLTRSPSLPVPVSRHAGRSDAANAGARVGSVSQAGESPDPSIIIAALSRVAEEMASPGDTGFPSAPGAQPEPDFPSAEASFPPPAEPSPFATAEPSLFRPAEPPSFPSAEPSPFATAEPSLFRPTEPPSFPTPESSPFPTAEPSPFAAAESAFPAVEPGVDDKPAGWDPIRVSSAWPTLRHTPPAAGPAGGNGSPGSAEAPPWQARSWGDAPNAAPAKSAAGWGATDSAAAGAAVHRASGAPTATATHVPGTGAGTGSGDSGTASSASRTRVVVLVAVLLCVLAILLAVFA